MRWHLSMIAVVSFFGPSSTWISCLPAKATREVARVKLAVHSRQKSNHMHGLSLLSDSKIAGLLARRSSLNLLARSVNEGPRRIASWTAGESDQIHDKRFCSATRYTVNLIYYSQAFLQYAQCEGSLFCRFSLQTFQATDLTR